GVGAGGCQVLAARGLRAALDTASGVRVLGGGVEQAGEPVVVSSRSGALHLITLGRAVGSATNVVEGLSARNASDPSRVPDFVGAILTAGAATAGRPTRMARLTGPVGLASAAACGVGVVVVAWWQGAPPATGPGAALTDAGRLTGLVAGYVAVLQLLLRARVGAIEKGLGTDRINATHRLLGAYLVLLVLAHGALVAT